MMAALAWSQLQWYVDLLLGNSLQLDRLQHACITASLDVVFVLDAGQAQREVGASPC
jgi:hypothetical protein